MKKDDVFTGTQVGVMIESLRSEVKVIAEGQIALRKDVTDIKGTLGRTLERVTMIEVTSRKILGTLEVHDGRFSRLEAAVLK